MTDKLYVRGITRTYSDRPASGGPAVALATSPSWPHIETTNAAERVTHIRPPATITTDAEGRWSVELVHAEGVQYFITCDGVKRLLDLDAVNTLGQPLYPVGAQVEWAALPSDFTTPPPPLPSIELYLQAAAEDYLAAHPPTGQVVSVAGRSGAVTLTKADVGLSGVDNTPDAAKPISTATATAIAALAPKVNPSLTATTPAPVLTTVTTPALSAWTLTGSATYGAGSITVGPASGSLSTDIPVTNDTVYQIDLTTSASTGGDVTVTLGAASATYPAAGITSVTVTATETGTRTLSISGTTWSATITGVTVRALTRLSPAATIGAAEVRAWGANTGLGSGAHRSLTTGTNNTGVGASAQRAITTGRYNTGIGMNAQFSLTSGGYNTGIGMNAQFNLTGGGYNTGIGYGAQLNLTSGGYNTGIGYGAQYNLTAGAANTALGTSAQYSLTGGGYNTAIGHGAQYNLTAGAANTALGTSAQFSLTTGGGNVAIGHGAQYTPAGNGTNATTTGARQVSIGVETGQSVSTQLNDITTLGYRARAGADFGTAVGSGAHAAHLRSVALGSTTTTTADDQVMVGTRDVEITSATRGVILRSPNGTRFRVTVTDAGTLTVSAA